AERLVREAGRESANIGAHVRMSGVDAGEAAGAEPLRLVNAARPRIGEGRTCGIRALTDVELAVRLPCDDGCEGGAEWPQPNLRPRGQGRANPASGPERAVVPVTRVGRVADHEQLGSNDPY